MDDGKRVMHYITRDIVDMNSTGGKADWPGKEKNQIAFVYGVEWPIPAAMVTGKQRKASHFLGEEECRKGSLGGGRSPHRRAGEREGRGGDTRAARRRRRRLQTGPFLPLIAKFLRKKSHLGAQQYPGSKHEIAKRSI